MLMNSVISSWDSISASAHKDGFEEQLDLVSGGGWLAGFMLCD